MEERFTLETNHYRLVLRRLWNGYLLPLCGGDEDTYSQVEGLLLCSLLGVPTPAATDGRIVLRPKKTFRTIPLLVGRPGGHQVMYWDYPIKEVETADVLFAFVRFFDWDVRVNRKFYYARTRIVGYGPLPELVGREALVAWRYLDAFKIERRC